MFTNTKSRALVAIIIFLLLSNIAILAFFLFYSDGRKNSHGKEDKNAVSIFLQKDIGFNKQQMDDYQKLRTAHMQSVKPLFDDIRLAKESFYDLLYINNIADSTINKAVGVIGEKQMALDVQMFYHFKNVRNLCTPQELPKFDTLFKKVVEKMTGGKFRKPGNKK